MMLWQFLKNSGNQNSRATAESNFYYARIIENNPARRAASPERSAGRSLVPASGIEPLKWVFSRVPVGGVSLLFIAHRLADKSQCYQRLLCFFWQLAAGNPVQILCKQSGLCKKCANPKVWPGFVQTLCKDFLTLWTRPGRGFDLASNSDAPAGSVARAAAGRQGTAGKS
ncbi:MAG TPA: hypothetical protein VIK53_07235 [Verrucomicrobiae bacterium]